MAGIPEKSSVYVFLNNLPTIMIEKLTYWKWFYFLQENKHTQSNTILTLYLRPYENYVFYDKLTNQNLRFLSSWAFKNKNIVFESPLDENCIIMGVFYLILSKV